MTASPAPRLSVFSDHDEREDKSEMAVTVGADGFSYTRPSGASDEAAREQTVFLRLFLTPMGMSPVVPEGAIIDDGGRPVVFVQRGGETFLRRPVKLGMRNHGMVQVLDGVKAGGRVVIKGAYLIRLSTMSSAVPAHGHVH